MNNQTAGKEEMEISRIEYEIKPENKLSLNLKELWSYRELFYFFSWRDIKVKYKQTLLGFAWAILQPTMMMLIFTILFGRVLKSNTEMNLPYPIFVYTGLMLWGIFSSGLQSAGNSMVSNSNIIKKIYFPRLIIPLSSILVSLFDFLMTLLPFALLAIYFDTSIDFLRLILFLPLSLIIILLTTFGAGCLLAALNIKYRDFRYILPFIIQFLMFATPVIYPLSIVDNGFLQLILNLNPVTTAITLFRSIFDNTVIINYDLTLAGIVVAILFLIIGLYYFRKTESYFADLA